MATGLNIILGTSLLIIMILLIRKLFGDKCNPNVRYFLWIFVAVRILVPLEFVWEIPESVLPENGVIAQILTVGQQDSDNGEKQGRLLGQWYKDILNAEEMVSGGEDFEVKNYDKKSADIMSSQTENIQSKMVNSLPDDLQLYAREKLPETTAAGVVSGNLLKNDEFDRGWDFAEVLRAAAVVIWIAGCVLMTGYVITLNVYTFVRLRKRKVGQLNGKVDVYEVEGYNCLVGIIRPYIFVATQVLQDEEKRKYVLKHEMQHYKAGDNFWLLIRTICLILQWFNPLVWIAYYRSQEDCELACDYRVTKSLNEEEKEAYAKALLQVLQLNVIRSNTFLTAAGDNKRIMRKRLESIFKGNHWKWAAGVTALVMVLAIGACTFISFYMEKDSSSMEQENTAPEETLPDIDSMGGQPAGGSEDTKAQLKLIADAHDMWFIYMDYANDMQKYTVTDMDANGRLEIIVSSMGGTGAYTYSDFYEVSETYDSLEKCTADFEEGDSQPDIMSEQRAVQVFMDSDKLLHYVFPDFIHVGTEYYEILYDVVLDNKQIWHKVLARKNESYSTGNSVITYEDASGAKISEAEYLTIAERTFFDHICVGQMQFGWQSTEELAGLGNDEVFKKLKASYHAQTWSNKELLGTDSYTDAITRLNALGRKFRNNAHYVNALVNLETQRILPDGREAYIGDGESFGNSAAMLDVDLDGSEELLLNIGGTCMADMGVYVFRYDESIEGDYKFFREFAAWPDVSFYTNGIVIAKSSHNHGYSNNDDFWPYHVYRYDADADEYVCIWDVDGWEKALREEDYDGRAFPDDIDADGDGMVYRITDLIENELITLDAADYEIWCMKLLDEAEKIRFSWTEL